MGQSIVKFLAIISLISAACAEPQFSFDLGSTQLLADKSKFRGTAYRLGYTLNPFSRLQFGLNYDYVSLRLNTYDNYIASGLLGDIRFVLNTLTNKSPYIGYSFGWLNSTVHSGSRTLYNARGSFTNEGYAGYTFRLRETLRLNFEYRQRVIDLKYAEKPYQRAETLQAGLSWILIPEPQVQKSLTPAESVTSKKDYIQKKLTYNHEQIARIDALIAKYDQRRLELGTDTNTDQERQYLIQQKQALEQQNQEMLQFLE